MISIIDELVNYFYYPAINVVLRCLIFIVKYIKHMNMYDIFFKLNKIY